MTTKLRTGMLATVRDPDGNVIARGKVAAMPHQCPRGSGTIVVVRDMTGGVQSWPLSQVTRGH